MISTQDLRNKEVINIYDGKSLGFVYDIEINLEKGTVEGIIVPAQKSFLSFFGWRDNDYVIKWKDIKRIGDDVILVDVAGVLEMDDYERVHQSRPSAYSGFDKDRSPGYGVFDKERQPGYGGPDKERPSSYGGLDKERQAGYGGPDKER